MNASLEKLGVDIRTDFQSDSLSPLLLALYMIPLTWLLRRAMAGFEWGNKEFKLNHLLFMNDLKLFAKSKNQIDSLLRLCIYSVRTFEWNFGIKK